MSDVSWSERSEATRCWDWAWLGSWLVVRGGWVRLESEFVGRKRRRRGKGWGLGGIRLEYWLVESWSLHWGEGGVGQAGRRDGGGGDGLG